MSGFLSPTLRRHIKRPRSPPGTPGPHTSDDRATHRQRAYPPASPQSSSKLRHFRSELFKMPDLRSGASTSTINEGSNEVPRPARVHVTPTSEDDALPDQTDDEAEPQDASPRRRPPPRRPNPPDLEDALTRLTQTVERMVAHHNQSVPAAADVAEDPAFNWDALRSPLEITFPLPPTGVVQRVAAGLFAKLQAGAITGRDQHEARFVLDVIADWEDLDQELRSRIFQRLNIYAIVAAHGWPTAIAASAASTSNSICVLPPGVQPVQQNRQQQRQAQRGGRRGANRPAPAAVPAPAPACGGRRRR